VKHGGREKEGGEEEEKERGERDKKILIGCI
jgi:hypothetical protein